jgi:hypothetical protein
MGKSLPIRGIHIGGRIFDAKGFGEEDSAVLGFPVSVVEETVEVVGDDMGVEQFVADFVEHL